ncbi:hypothetical protein ABZP36_001949 [Zizania latifolia]
MDRARRVRFNSNFDLFQSPAAKRRDTLFLEMAPEGLAPEEIPVGFRGTVPEYVAAVQRLGAQLFELLSEALGLPVGHLGRDTGCVDGLSVVAHYYPACPEPHLTADAGHYPALGLRLPDRVVAGHGYGGTAGAPQAGLVSNDRLKSVEHRVVASGVGSRVSVACFFLPPYASTRAYGPIVIASGSNDARPAPVYRSTTAAEFLELCPVGAGALQA